MKESVSSACNKEFALSGPAGRIDRRVTAVRGDLACISLAGRVFAPHYVVPDAFHCTATHAAIHAEPRPEGEAVSELLAGEPFAFMDRTGDWAWGQAADGTCGFVAAADLGAGQGTLRVSDSTDIATFAEAALARPYADGGQGGAGYCGAGLLRRAALAIGTELPAFADLQAESDALTPADGPERGVLLFAGEAAAICISDSEAVTALPGRGVVKATIAELVADGAEPIYRRIAP